MRSILISKLIHITKSSYLSHRLIQTLTKGHHLKINPIRCLQDEPINIEIKGLSPGTEVTLSSDTKDLKGNIFLTYTHYRSDNNGDINLSFNASLGGTYKGIFPMGPIAHLEGGPTTVKYLRYVNKDVTAPLSIKFNLFKGHLDANKVLDVDPDLILDSVDHERIYLPSNCQRIPVRQGRIRGTLFLPEGDGPFPGIIDVFGTAGGLIEARAAQFAARGFAAFALAYFDFEDLPKDLNELDIAYFQEAIDFLTSQEKVKKDKIGAVGISKGGDLVCSLGTFIPVVKAVVCINAIPVNTWCPLHLKDRTIPGLFFNWERQKVIEPGVLETMAMMDDSEAFPETHLPLHEADAKFLFLVGKEDRNWRTELENERAVARMRAHGNTNFEIVKYEGTGHLLEAPYTPFSFVTHHKLANAAFIWGGNAYDHTHAQVDSWKRILKFLKTTLA